MSAEDFWSSADPFDRCMQQIMTPSSVLEQTDKAIESAAVTSRDASTDKPASFSHAALSAIRGTTDAQRLIFTIRDGCAPPDALLDGMVQVLKQGDPERTRGFFRELQKRLERA